MRIFDFRLLIFDCEAEGLERNCDAPQSAKSKIKNRKSQNPPCLICSRLGGNGYLAKTAVGAASHMLGEG
jgi:hypothetical protein